MSTRSVTPESIDTREPGTVAFTGLVLHDTYTLGPCIGRGGMGEVYEATHARLPGRMAVKILRPHLRGNKDAFARFCREAEIMSALRHPHIIKIIDFNTSTSLDGLPYFVMEYLDGVDLERRLADSGPLSLAATVRIIDAVASALGAAHAAGVVHRDLKPANIFLMRGEAPDADFVRVIDFGISKAPGAGPEPSDASVVFGTPAFMAPEQALGLVSQVDARTDQFALAAITHAMLAGRQPFVGDSAAALLYQVAHQPHPPLSQFVSWDATHIQTVLDRALAKRQQDRFEDVVEFAQALGTAAGISIDSGPHTAVEPAPRVRAPFVPAARFVPATPFVSATPFGDADLSRSIDRVPRGPQRAVALGLAVVGLAAFVGYKGWQDGRGGRGGRVGETSHHLIGLAVETWRALKSHGSVPAPAATALPIALPAVEPAVKDLVAARQLPARHIRPRRSAVSRSGWQSIQLVSLPPLPPPEGVAGSTGPEEPAPSPTEAPDGFPIPEPAPAPPDVTAAAR